MYSSLFWSCVLTLATLSNAKATIPHLHARDKAHVRRAQITLPKDVQDFQTKATPEGTLRWKNPGDEGICKDKKTYSGYIDTTQNGKIVHTFFWFVEADKNMADAPLTIWLPGGPGGQVATHMFDGLGPCFIDKKGDDSFETVVNKFGWNGETNLLFIDQPAGAGFSYMDAASGGIDGTTGALRTQSDDANVAITGRYPVVDYTFINTSKKAAEVMWGVLQVFYDGVGAMASNIKNKDLHLWSSSYGGHYGPQFAMTFLDKLKTSSLKLEIKSLGIGNGLIDLRTQAEYWPIYARGNPYHALFDDDNIPSFMEQAVTLGYGCNDLIDECNTTPKTTDADAMICATAYHFCLYGVEGPGEDGNYRVSDVREQSKDKTMAAGGSAYSDVLDFFDSNSNLYAIGANINLPPKGRLNQDVFYAFQASGELAFNDFLGQLGDLLTAGVRVNLYYGDADYTCNYLGGEAVANAIKWSNDNGYKNAGEKDLMVNGNKVGTVKQYGKLSFARVYNAGHRVHRSQPEVLFNIFQRTVQELDIASGKTAIKDDYST